MTQEQQKEDKIVALENQAYLSYLQLNALVKQLADKQIIDTALLIKDMDELNTSLVKAVEEEVGTDTTEAEAETFAGEVSQEPAVQ